MNKTIQIEHTVEEINAILHALAMKPYVEVADLIHKIRRDAEAQLAADAPVAVPDNPKE